MLIKWRDGEQSRRVAGAFGWWDCSSRSVYLLKSFMKLWNPSSPKKSNVPSELPRWTTSRTRRPNTSRGIKRFQPDARMLYHFALSEHSCAARKSPKVFWSRAWRYTNKKWKWVSDSGVLAHKCLHVSSMVPCVGPAKNLLTFPTLHS